jgi:hypothetical protein
MTTLSSPEKDSGIVDIGRREGNGWATNAPSRTGFRGLAAVKEASNRREANASIGAGLYK